MTDDEKRQQKAMLLLEHQEAEENLAQLREKAGRISAPFAKVGKWLEYSQMNYLGGYEREKAQINGEIRSNLDAYRQAMNFDETLSLMDEIVAAERKLRDPSQRKQALGLK